MHIEEAEWIAKKLQYESKESLSPLLNIGSSTEEFRVKQQPYIDSIIFKPLRCRGIDIVHQDIKAEIGVDIVGDLTDQTFLNQLQKLQFKLIICSNLIEHIGNKTEVINALLKIIPVGGYVIVTVPSKYPKHMDPIDTMFRPTPNELARLFQEMEVIDSSMIDVGTVWSSLSKDRFELVRLVLRVTMPFYRFNGWITVFNKMLWMFRKRIIACVLLQKIDYSNKSMMKSVVTSEN